MVSEAQVSANRRNAAKSTGPRTTQGKAVIARNAIKHGLLARQNVILGEDPEEFDLHRREVLDEMGPVGTMETLLGERIVSLTWRLKRAERLQNEVFDSLLTEELAESMADLDDEVSAEEERELMSDPSADPRLAVGRMVARDFRRDRVLDRLLTYERQIEGCLRRTMADLEHRQLKRKAEGGHSPVHGPLVSRVGDSAKQSQFPEDVPGETKPMDSKVSNVKCEVPSGAAALQASHLTLDSSRQTPAGVTASGTGSAGSGALLCETKPISDGQSDETSGSCPLT